MNSSYMSNVPLTPPLFLPVVAYKHKSSSPSDRASMIRKRGIRALLAQRGQAHGSTLGVYRWVVERTLGWLHQFRRLRVR